MLLEYEDINKSHIAIAAFKLFNDNNEEIYVIIIEMIFYIKILCF